MHKQKILLFILVAAVVAIIVLTLREREHYANDDEVAQTQEDVRELCYIWNTEAGDSATLKLRTADGTNFTGSMDFAPAEKDRKSGSFEGTAGPVDRMAMARTGTFWWNASAEGTTVTEELSVRFGEGVASIGFGEMKDRGDGAYVYADPSKIDYSFNLMQTDCGDPAVK